MKKGKEILLEEMKSILLEEMEYLDIFCQKNNINYFLIGGSLLGAVRHKGFIPWDDDIDVGMLRKDYEKFINSFNKNETNRYKVINIDTSKEYYLPFSKIIDTRTILFEEVNSNISLGISIDIFPYDNCPNDDYQEACNFANSLKIYRNILSIKSLAIRKERSILKNIFIKLAQIFFSCVSKKYLIKKINSIISQYSNNDNSKYVAELSYMPYGNREIYEKIWLEKTIKLPFEQYKFSVPIAYHKFLEKTFGDYMKLPPLEKQVSHHNFKCWWKI